MYPSERVVVAEAIAVIAHHGQVDKAGRPYIEHPRRVAEIARSRSELDSFDVTVVALLHDTVEDTAVGLDMLATIFPEHLVDAVDAITRRPGEPRQAYYARVAANKLAYQVKLADIADNIDPARLAVLDVETSTRLTGKYEHALQVLHELHSEKVSAAF